MLMLSGQIDQLTRLKREAAIKMGDTDPALIWPAPTCWAIANLEMNEKKSFLSEKCLNDDDVLIISR